MTAHFTSGELGRVRRAVVAHLNAIGLRGSWVDDFVVAVNELVANAIQHGGGRGRIHLDYHDDVLTCHVTDVRTSTKPTVRRPSTGVPGGRGLWLASQLTDTLNFTCLPDGLTATVTTRPGATA